MATIYVQFEDNSRQQIISVFAGPQDPEEWPDQGEVETSDQRWHAYYQGLPAIVQRMLPEPE